MNCIECKRQVNFMWHTGKGFVCGSCLIPTIQGETDLEGFQMIREAYQDQFSVGISASQPISTFRPVLEAMEKFINQSRSI